MPLQEIHEDDQEKEDNLPACAEQGPQKAFGAASEGQFAGNLIGNGRIDGQSSYARNHAGETLKASKPESSVDDAFKDEGRES